MHPRRWSGRGNIRWNADPEALKDTIPFVWRGMTGMMTPTGEDACRS
jgi:hypothetical protein